jgi:hypothetical protein
VKGWVLAALLLGGVAHGFTVGSGGAAPCHEWITSYGFVRGVCELSPRSCAITDVAEPDAVTRRVLAEHSLVDDWRVTFAHVSLVEGVRWNDLHGHGISELARLREIHEDDGLQHEHCLRSRDDDGAAGDRAALARCRRFIEGEIAEAKLAFAEGRLERVPVFLEFYGTVELELWGGWFHLGRALHALQDLHTHALRTGDLSAVVAVTTYVECHRSDYDERRDGLCHSLELDRCFEHHELGGLAED